MAEVRTATPQTMSARSGEMSGIDAFVIVGLSDMMFKDKATKELKCNINTLISVKIDDQMSINHLRGGLGNPKLLPIYGIFRHF